MRTILLIATVLALMTLAVGGVSAHDGNQDADEMDEMMDRCMEMMGSEPIDEQDRSETMDTETNHHDAMSSEETAQTGMGNY